MLAKLRSWARSTKDASLRLRAKVILELRKDGVSATYAAVATVCGVSETTVSKWRRRFLASIRAYSAGTTGDPLEAFSATRSGPPGKALKRAAKLLRRGKSTRVVARDLELSQSAVARLRKTLARS